MISGGTSYAMSRRFEQLAPLVVAGTFGLAVAYLDHILVFSPLPLSVSAGAMALGMIVSGFTATQRNMLLNMGGSRVLRYAAVTGYYHDVLAYLAHCIYAGLAVTLLSLIGIFVVDQARWICIVWLSFWSGSIVLTVALLFRNEALMARIFLKFMEEQKGSG